MKTTIVGHNFTAVHSVPRDARFSASHQHDWRLVAHVTGPETGTGWIISFQDLAEILRGCVPPSGDLDELAPNATVEALVDAFWDLVSMSLPSTVWLAKLVLHETADFSVSRVEEHPDGPQARARRFVRDQTIDLGSTTPSIP